MSSTYLLMGGFFPIVHCFANRLGVILTGMRNSDFPAPVRPLAAMGQVDLRPAPWMAAALKQEPERTFVAVRGARIETLCWGRRGAPGLLFLHGTGAHADWWSHIAPFFAEDWRCAALSWSGMGKSDHRDHYTLDLYAEEVAQVIAAAGLAASGAPPVAVAHSFGSLSAMKASARPGLLSGIIAVDAAILQDILRGKPDDMPYRDHERFQSVEAALARFRLRPHQTITDYYIVDRIARQGLMQLRDGMGEWTWRADPYVRRDIVAGGVADVFRQVGCPLFQLWGGRSQLTMRTGAIELIQGALGMRPPQMTIPEAGHHIMLDYPLELVSSLRAILASWPPDGACPC